MKNKVTTVKKIIFNSLLLSAAIGAIIVIGVAVNTVQRPMLTSKSTLIFDLFFGLTIGITTYLQLIYRIWVPKLTWLMLAFFIWIFLPLGNLVSGAILGLFILFGINAQMQFVSQLLVVLGPLIAFGLWLLIGNLSIRAISSPANRQQIKDGITQNIPRIIISAASLIAVFIVVATNWLVGIGNFIATGLIGIMLAIVLAIFGTTARITERRTPLFLFNFWVIPSLMYLVLIIFLLRD